MSTTTSTLNPFSTGEKVKPQKRTFRLIIKRTDNRIGIPFLSLDKLNSEGIILTFQCDPNTEPKLMPLMELLI